MNSFILRAKPHDIDREEEFLEGRLSIGWPCNQSLEGADRDQIKGILSSFYEGLSEVSISMVDLFVHMPKDAIILTPSLQDKTLIHLFKTTSNYKYDPLSDNEKAGNPHFINAIYLKTVVRNLLPKPVLKSLSGARKTLSRISQHYGILDEYISNNFQVNRGVKPKYNKFQCEAIDVIYNLLDSEDEHVRLKAAIAIIELS